MIYLAVAVLTYTLFYVKNHMPRKKFDFSIKKFNDSSQKISILAVVILIVIAGLRDVSVGFDLVNYKNNYDIFCRTSDLYMGHAFESGFQYLNIFCSRFFGAKYGFTIMLLIIATVEVLCVTFAAKRFSSDISMTMFLYVCMGVYLNTFDGVRQGICVAILIFSICYLVDNKPLKFISMILLASCFHKTSIIFAIVYLFYWMIKKGWQRWLYIICLVACVIFILWTDQIIKIVCNIFDLGYYEKYVVSGFGKGNISAISKMEAFAHLLCLICFILLGYWEKRKKSVLPTTYDLYVILYFVSVIIIYVSIILKTILTFDRLGLYFNWALIFLVPMFIRNIRNNKYKEVLKVGALCAGFVYLCLSVLYIDAYGIVPYIFIRK